MSLVTPSATRRLTNKGQIFYGPRGAAELRRGNFSGQVEDASGGPIYGDSRPANPIAVGAASSGIGCPSSCPQTPPGTTSSTSATLLPSTACGRLSTPMARPLSGHASTSGLAPPGGASTLISKLISLAAVGPSVSPPADRRLINHPQHLFWIVAQAPNFRKIDGRKSSESSCSDRVSF